MKPFGGVAKYSMSCFLEKLLPLIYIIPVPRTNTRAQGEYPKVSEITIAKELCKIAPYVRKKGRLFRQAAVKRSSQLFNKNTALC